MSGIFKAYDIRGIFPIDINEEIAEKIGRAYIEFTANYHLETRNNTLGRYIILSLTYRFGNFGGAGGGKGGYGRGPGGFGGPRRF